MKLSVAIAVYNGAEYIGEQLDSLSAQTRPPDELVVWDNASTDGTIEVLKGFAKSVSFPTRIFEGDENLGYTGGSEKAVELCTGDVIFPCDHDDSWLPWKLAGYEEVFLERPEVGAIFSNSIVVDGEMKPTGKDLWTTADFNPRRRREFPEHPFETLLRGNVVYGNTFAFRSSMREFMLPFSTLWDADEWIALLAAVSGTMTFLDRPSIKYRQHSSNFVGAKERASLSQGITESRNVNRRTFYTHMIRQHEALEERIIGANLAATDSQEMRFLREKISHLRFRAGLGGNLARRAVAVVPELAKLRYHRYSNGLRSAARDALISGL